MLKILNTTQATATNREIDENGYLTVHNCLLLPNGIMEYLGSELIEGNEDNNDIIDGITIDPDKIYKLNISDSELEKSLDSFKLIPIVNEHVFLGKDGKNPKDYQEGSVGENLEIKNIIDEEHNIYRNYIVGTLKFTNPDTIKLIKEGIKDQLSTSYTNDLKRSDNDNYDFEVINIVGNHVALVEKGRAGSKVRVSNSDDIINYNNKNQMTDKMINIEIKDLSMDKDKADFQEEEESNLENSIDNNNTKEEKTCNDDESYNDIAEFLKSKLDSDSIKILIDKLSKINTNNSNDEDIEISNEPKSETEEDEDNDSNKVISQNSLEHIYNSIKSKLESEQKAVIKAYNSVKNYVGDFNFIGMSTKDIYRYALSNSNIPINGNETLGELKAMFNVFNSTRSKVDNSSYNELSGNSFKLPSYLK